MPRRRCRGSCLRAVRHGADRNAGPGGGCRQRGVREQGVVVAQKEHVETGQSTGFRVNVAKEAGLRKKDESKSHIQIQRQQCTIKKPLHREQALLVICNRRTAFRVPEVGLSERACKLTVQAVLSSSWGASAGHLMICVHTPRTACRKCGRAGALSLSARHGPRSRKSCVRAANHTW